MGICWPSVSVFLTRQSFLNSWACWCYTTIIMQLCLLHIKTSRIEAWVSVVNILCPLLHPTTIHSHHHLSLLPLAAVVIFWLSYRFLFVEEPLFTKVNSYSGQTVSPISRSEVPHFSKSKEIYVQITVVMTTSLRIEFWITISLWQWQYRKQLLTIWFDI